MAQKFINLDDAAEKLGLTADRLNQLRDEGRLRGYRDGASWKFRIDEIEKLVVSGLPSPMGSDLSIDMSETEQDFAPIKLPDEDLLGDEPTIDLDSDSDLDLDSDLDNIEASDKPAISDLDLDLDDDLLGTAAAASDISLDDLDDATLPVDESAPSGEVEPVKLDDLEVLSLDDDDDESVLLSETEFGDSGGRPPSTIIGKVDLDPNGDMDLVLESEEEAGQSDVKLASPAGSADSGAIAMPEEVAASDPEVSRAQFSDIEELELDLEAESSQILSSDDTEAARKAAQPEAELGAESDVGLAEASDIGLSGGSSLELDEGISGGLTGISELGIGEGSDAGSVGGMTGISSLELDDDDDGDVFDDGSGSDITLTSQDSGINLISPSDSGLALDDAPLDLGGAAMGSSLDLGDAVEESIVLDDPSGDLSDSGKPEASGDFLLTPSFEDAEGEADDESSSQIIALDEVSEDEGAAALLGGADDGMLGDDFAASGLAAGAATVAAIADEESFSMGTIVGLAACIMLMCLCGMMSYDLVRNIWSWNEPYSLNSSLIDAVLSLLPS